jgi:hypothetical protein
MYCLRSLLERTRLLFRSPLALSIASRNASAKIQQWRSILYPCASAPYCRIRHVALAACFSIAAAGRSAAAPALQSGVSPSSIYFFKRVILSEAKDPNAAQILGPAPEALRPRSILPLPLILFLTLKP